MGNLPSPKENRDFYPLSPSNKPSNITDLVNQVMRIRPRTHLDFLDGHKGLLFLGPLRFFPLNVTELPVIHDAAYRRLSLRGHLDQIQFLRLYQLERFVQRHDAQLVAFRAYDPNFTGTDLMIDSRLFRYKPPPF